MTPDMQQARTVISQGDDSPYPSVPSAGHFREAAQMARPRNLDAFARPSHPSSQSEPSPPSQAEARRAQEDASIVGTIPFLAVLVVAVSGVYIAWHQGSAGGGQGGVIGGLALLVAAVARLLLPARLAGLLATRKRAKDVVTFTIFGTALLVAGLVLPR